MIQRQTRLISADNTGAKQLMVIGIPGASDKRVVRLGDIVTVVVKGASPEGTVKDHEIAKAVVVRTHKEQRRLDGSYIRFDDNAGVIIGKDNNPVGTRIFGPIARELREKGFMKVVSLAAEVW